MALLNRKAQTLKEAMRNLDPVHSLEVDELDRYFVEREQSPISEMAIFLEDTIDQTDPQKILFTGHRGNGKSTELAKLEKHLHDKFFVVRYALRNILDLYDISYVDVLLSIAIQMMEKVQAESVKLGKPTEELLELRWSFAREIEQEIEQGNAQQNDVSLGTSLMGIFSFKNRLSNETSTRQVMRERVTPNINNLFEGIDVLAQDIKQKTGKPLLCIIEDLDKIDISKAEEIFYKHTKSISDPKLAIIYTFPVALHHSNEFTNIAHSFNVRTLPNFKTTNRERIANVLLQRLEARLVSEDALNLLVDLSGGIPRNMLRLAQSACTKARVAATTQIIAEHVQGASIKERNEFNRMLTLAQRELLKKVRDTKAVDQTEEYRDLLHNLSILEYENGSSWYDVNPVVRGLLE